MGLKSSGASTKKAINPQKSLCCKKFNEIQHYILLRARAVLLHRDRRKVSRNYNLEISFSDLDYFSHCWFYH